MICSLLVIGAIVFFAIKLLKNTGKQSPISPPPIPPTVPQPPFSPVNQSTRRVCPQCGNEMAAGTTQGLCPSCLMKVAMGSEGGNPDAVKERKPAPPSDEIAKHFPQLEILELLGHGGMGMVYKARQPQLDRHIALKILSPELSRDPAFAERFNREAKALARLNHPNIVGIYDFGKAGDFYYFIMEFVDGMNLWDLERAKKLTPEEALAIVPKICDALQYAHDEGIVHRDIKPGNILIDKKGRVKIADFGLAKLAGTQPHDFRLTQTKMTLGTPHYMAPEQLSDPQTVDHRADIYSLGVVFSEMLTGELPMGRFALPSEKVHVDVRLDEVVLRTLQQEPGRRYQHVSEVKTQIETIATTPGSSRREEAQTQSGGAQASQTAAPQHNPREITTVVGATAFLVVMFFVLLGIALEFPRQATAPFILMGMCAIGLVSCVVSLAGLWPFPSPAFPKPNFSSRNLRRRATNSGSAASATAAQDILPAVNCPVTMTAWLALMDAGDYARSWETAAPYFQCSTSKEEWVARLEKIRRPLGEVLSRKILSVTETVFGSRYEGKYESSFDGLLAATETVTYAKQPSGEWKAIGYFIHPTSSGIGDALKSSLLRLTLIVAVALVLTEVAIQISGHWRESDHERWFILFAVGAVGGSVWVPWRFFRAPHSLQKWIVGVITVCISFAVVVAVSDFYGNYIVPRFTHLELKNEMDISFGRVPVKSETLLKQSFGPVSETILKSPKPRRVAELLDLDTGLRAISTNFGADDRQTHAWIRSNRLDVLGVIERGQIAVLCMDMVVVAARSNGWDSVSAANVTTNWNLSQSEPNKITGISPGTDKTDTWFFRTREGGQGILQILGQEGDPPGVKIRYKLVQGAAQSHRTNTIPEKHLSFGPVTNGLCAALELVSTNRILGLDETGDTHNTIRVLVSTNGVFTLGESFEVRFHIRNVSKTNIIVAGGSWRQDAAEDVTIRDEQGKKIPVKHSWYSGITPIQRNVLQPGESVGFRSSSLEFLAEDTNEKMVTHPVGNYVKVKPGRYTVSYRLRFPDLIEGGATPPDDWQGELETALVTVLISSQSAATFTIPFLSAQQHVAVITEANKAFTSLVHSDQKERDGDNIPKKFWGDAILNLKPLRVVNDRVNIKIVLADDGRVEAGFYVNLPISSFAPPPDSFLEFVPLSQPTDKAFGTLYRYKFAQKPVRK